MLLSCSIFPKVLIFWSGIHYRALPISWSAMNRCSDFKKSPTNLCRRTELGYRTVQHVDVVEEVNDWRQQNISLSWTDLS